MLARPNPWSVVGIVANEPEQEAIDLLQELGLKEYEAKCFAALTKLPSGTAKEVSDTAAVPRTRVYDAVRILESEGLVEVQHGNPQRFRALSIDEAISILSDRYSSRVEELDRRLREIDTRQTNTEESPHEVWSLSGTSSIATRARGMVRSADDEIVLVVGSEDMLTEALYESLRAATGADADVIVGALRSPIREEIRDHVPGAEVFETELDWLEASETETTPVSVGIITMVDRSELLVSSQSHHESGERVDRAIVGEGFSNGLVVIARRLLARGLEETRDPGM